MTINQKKRIEVICNFTSIDECEDAINAIKNGHPVLLYFGDIETTLANSIFTIMSGAVYALDGLHAVHARHRGTLQMTLCGLHAAGLALLIIHGQTDGEGDGEQGRYLDES